MPRCARLRVAVRVMSRPNSSTAPESGAISPVMRLNRVVLPAPFGPMIRRRSPGSTARLTLVVTRRPPNDLQRLRTASALMALAPRSEPAPSRAGGSVPACRTPRRAHQPHGAGHQALGHEHHDGDEDRAKHEIPARDIGADHVLDDDDQRRADDRSEQACRAAGDHHQQAFGGRGQRQRLRADELVVVDEQHAGDARSRSPDSMKAQNRIIQTW